MSAQRHDRMEGGIQGGNKGQVGLDVGKLQQFF